MFNFLIFCFIMYAIYFINCGNASELEVHTGEFIVK